VFFFLLRVGFLVGFRVLASRLSFCILVGFDDVLWEIVLFFSCVLVFFVRFRASPGEKVAYVGLESVSPNTFLRGLYRVNCSFLFRTTEIVPLFRVEEHISIRNEHQH